MAESEPARSTDVVSDELRECAFCGNAMRISVGVNPYGRCETPGCWMNSRMIGIPTEDPRQVAEWNTRARISRAPIEAVAGWKLVPKAPPASMRVAGAEAADVQRMAGACTRDIAVAAYAAMLAAAPAHPLPQGAGEPAGWANGEVLANIRNGRTPVLNANKVGFFDTPLYTRSIGEAGDTDELADSSADQLTAWWVERFGRPDNRGMWKARALAAESSLAAIQAKCCGCLTPAERDETINELSSSLAAEKQHAADNWEHFKAERIALSRWKARAEAAEQRVVELTADRDEDERIVRDKERLLVNTERAWAETREAMLEALEPFAKTGELFETPAYDKYTATVFAPDAGSEYALTSSQLRRATEVFRAALAPVTTPPAALQTPTEKEGSRDA